MIVLILAGGKGTRLWPFSRDVCPKQFLNFGNQLTFLQKTILRFVNLSGLNKIFISTSDRHKHLVEEQIISINASCHCEIISEPFQKNTAPSLAYSIRYLQEVCKISSEERVLVTPSDHFIEPEFIFHQYLGKIYNQALSKIIVFGIMASKPETGYGYIERGVGFDSLTFEVKRFIEKPSLELAQTYVSSGNHYWNSGMFFFTIDLFWNQLKIHTPDIFEISNGSFSKMREHYDRMPNISIDYALMEKTKEMLVCPLALGWSDVGSWDNIYEVLQKDNKQNILIGNVHAFDTNGCLIIGNGKKIISTIGLDDLLIIDTEDALLISRKGESQSVKHAVQSFNLDKN